jgi:hypothetical protein
MSMKLEKYATGALEYTIMTSYERRCETGLLLRSVDDAYVTSGMSRAISFSGREVCQGLAFLDSLYKPATMSRIQSRAFGNYLLVM